jgi:glyoxylase-like metal-dependent hydrolase (beta-lactamase superfamily II)
MSNSVVVAHCRTALAKTGLVAALVVATLATAASAVEPQKPYSELSPRPMWAEKVKEGLYVIRGPLGPCLPMPCPAVATPVNPDGLLHEPGDVAVRVTPEGLILVDTKFAYNIPELLDVIKTISDQPIKYVLASHYHADHNGGIGEMIKLGATVVVNEQLRDAYDRSKRDGSSPQVTFGDYGSIQLGGVKVEMHHFATGHTRGDTFVYFPDLKVVHTGDVAPEGMPTFDYRDGASAIGWVNEMYDLLKLDFDWAIPGHGRLLTKDEIRQYVKNVEIMNERMKNLVRDGVPVEDIGKRLKLDDLGWDRSASTNTFLYSGSIPGYYAEMKALLEQEQRLETRR